MIRDKKRVTIEPLSLRLRGFTIDELFSKEFIEALRKELPDAMVSHIGISFQDSESFVEVSQSIDETKSNLEHIDVIGDEPKHTKGVAGVMDRVLTG